MSTSKNKDKAIQYIKLLEEYDQADTIYDTCVYGEPGSPKSSLPPIQPSFSAALQIENSKTNLQISQLQKEQTGWESLWDSVEKSLEVSDPKFLFINAWNSTQATLTTAAAEALAKMRSPPQDAPNKQQGTTDEEVQATVHAIKTSNKTKLPDSLAAKARTNNKNRTMPKRTHGSRSPSSAKLRVSSQAKQHTKEKRSDHIQLVPASVYRDPTEAEERTPPPPAPPSPVQATRPTLQTQDSMSKPVDPEETSVIHKEKKELAAKKRAERAKQKGAVKKAPLMPPPRPEAHPTWTPKSVSLPTAGAPAGRPDPTPAEPEPIATSPRKAAGNICDVSASMATASSHTRTSSTASGPRVRRTVNKEPPGHRKDPPGVSRKGYNDDATVVPPRKHSMIFVEEPPRSIDLGKILETKKPTPEPSPFNWTTLLTGGVIPECAGPQRQATPPPLRPCDIPRGSELKKKNESVRFPGVAGEFLNAAFGL